MAKIVVQRQSQTLFQLWVDDVQRAYETLLADAEAQIVRMRLQGIADSQIFDRLETSFNNGKDLFQSYKGWVQGATDKLANNTAQVVSNSVTAKSGTTFDWVLDPTAKEHCADCVKNSREPAKRFDEWSAIGLPGAGNTECDGYCKCTLMRAA